MVSHRHLLLEGGFPEWAGAREADGFLGDTDGPAAKYEVKTAGWMISILKEV